MERRAWWRVAGFAIFVGVLSGLALFGVVVLPLSFFASVTEPSAGRQRPLFRTGVAVAGWLAPLVGAGAAVAAAWFRSRPEGAEDAADA